MTEAHKPDGADVGTGEAPDSGPSPVSLIVLTGMSGSGKSTALRALEDAGYYCIDNLPAELLEDVGRLAQNSQDIRRVALAMDIRHTVVSSDIVERLEAFAANPDAPPLQIVFLTASDDKVIGRFSETRRRHPVMTAGTATSLRDAMALERQWLSPLRHRANSVIDTTDLTVHDLKRVIQQRFGEPGDRLAALQIMSFGFKYGPPREADFVFDVRYLDNPYFNPELRHLTGHDDAVYGFVMEQPAAKTVFGHITALLQDVLPWCDKEGKATVTVGIGCTGGQHRSVAMTRAVGEYLARTTAARPLLIQHREHAAKP